MDVRVDEIADRFEQETRVTRNFSRGAGGFKRQRNALSLGYRLVELGHVRGHRIEVEHREAGAARAALDLGDAQQRGEGGENALCLCDRLV